MVIQIAEGNITHCSFRAMAIDPSIIASITLLDPMESNGHHASMITFKQEVCVGLSEDNTPLMAKVVKVEENISDLAEDAGLDPENKLMKSD